VVKVHGVNFIPVTHLRYHKPGCGEFVSFFEIDSIDSLWEKLVLYIKNPLDQLIFNSFHASSEYFEAGNDHFTLLRL
jgi:hypothetical protein